MESQKKYCSTCQTNRPIETFEEGFATCSRCKKKKLNRYYRLREHYLELKKEYRQNHKEEISEKHKEYFQSIKDVIITCPVCNYEIKKYKKSQHEKSQTHQNNLKRQEHPEEFENEEKPDRERE